MADADPWAIVGPSWRALRAGHAVTLHTEMEEWARAHGDTADAGDDPTARSRWFYAEDDDGPAALLHCVLTRRRTAGARVTVLTNGLADGALADRCRPESLRRDLLRAFARADDPVDVVSLDTLRPGEAFHRLVTGWSIQTEWRHGGYCTVDTSRPAQEWFGAASKNLRSSLRKAQNRLEREGRPRWDVVTAPEDVGRAFDDYVALEAAGWKGLKGGLANQPEQRRVLRRFLVDAAAAGRASVRTLWVDDRLAASHLGARAGSTLALFKTSYLEDLSYLSPGILLMANLVEACCDDPGIDRIDLLRDYDWHHRWHPERHPTFRVRHFNARRAAGLAGLVAAPFVERRSGAKPD